MSGESMTRAILAQDGRVLVEQPDGSYRPTESKTDWDRVRAMTEEEIEAAAKADLDAPPLDEEFWRTARIVTRRPRSTPASASTPMCSTGSGGRGGAGRPA
jgi:hypothetical protein